jgi:hypothetical protein
MTTPTGHLHGLRGALRRAPLYAFAAATLLLSATPAHAYCRSASCPEKNEPGRTCNPASTDDCGTPILWARSCVGFTLQRDASKQVALSQAQGIFTKAFDAWMNAACPGGHPSIRVSYTGNVTCDAVEYNSDKRNANIIVFRDESWPHSGVGVLALTTVTFSRATGEIYDADMEVNTAQYDFAVSDTAPGADLLSVATHEAGHFLGLAHSADPEATMFAAYTPGTITQRTLEADDIAGICAIYPPADAKGPCDSAPRHGFSALCGEDQDGAGGDPGSGGAPGEGSGGDDGNPDDGGAGGSAASAPPACGVSFPSVDELGIPETILLLLGYLLVRRRRSPLPRSRRAR